MKKFKKELEELGKKFYAELYGFSYNEDGSDEIKSDWDVDYGYINDKFEDSWTILDIIALGDDSSIVESRRECKIHIYSQILSDFQDDNFIIEIIDKPNRLGIVEITLRKCEGRRKDDKVFKIILKREAVANIKSWRDLIDNAVMTSK